MKTTEYVRHALGSVGFNQPTDEVVDKMCMDAQRVTDIGVFAHPYEAIVVVLRAYYPTSISLDFIAAMHKLENQAGVTAAEVDGLNERLARIGEEECM